MHDQVHGTASAALEPDVEELGAAQQQFEILPVGVLVSLVSAALLRNTSARQTARLKLKVTGDTSSLGMSYSPNP